MDTNPDPDRQAQDADPDPDPDPRHWCLCLKDLTWMWRSILQGLLTNSKFINKTSVADILVRIRSADPYLRLTDPRIRNAHNHTDPGRSV
jgi:hypothetical protein